ncbi:hypothetical protein PENSUB_11037 [Penicillium subrubescens]|uniref:Uncharacterized protein n=1 Tax=Penicillium subrubescens TaxID=1316194 RepID=A0A1Q5T5T2_9EURO|nr:hypothetical protein PENSUB_11037 [Penicillium subrubescens]
MASFLQPELSQDFDTIVQEVQNQKDQSLTERLNDKNRIQGLERDLAACRAEISQLKTHLTMSYEAVSERFRRIYRSLSQWVSGFPKFPRVALNWQAVGHFVQDGSYSQDLYPLVGYDKENFECERELLLLYSIWLILYKCVFQTVLVGADIDTQVILRHLFESFSSLEPNAGSSLI